MKNNALNVPMKKITQHSDRVSNIVISPRLNYVASFGMGRDLIISNEESGEEVMKVDLYRSPMGVNPNHFCFSNCDKYIYIIKSGIPFRIQIKTGSRLLLDDDISNCNAISVNESRDVVVGGDDYIAVIWDTPRKNGVGVSFVKHKHGALVVKITDFNEVIFVDREGGVYQFNPLDENMKRAEE